MVWKELDYGVMNEKEKRHVVSEVNFLRELRHPFIVKYYDRVIDKAAMKLYIVMESCDGGDLQQLIRKCRRDKVYVREETIWKMFAQLTLALSACHHHTCEKDGTVQPILHRDVKPGNVFLDRFQNVKIGDFGLAKQLNSKSTFAYTNVGTPYYMSPELVNEDRYNESSDVWALGCLLYELASLRTPFDAHNAVSLAIKINTAKVPRLPRRYSDELNAIVHEMLHKSSAARPTLKRLQTMRGPNGVFERYVKEGKLRVAEHTFHHRMASQQREMKSRKKALMKREESLRRRERALEKRLADLERREHAFQARRRQSETRRTEEEERDASVSTPKVIGGDENAPIRTPSLAAAFEARMASLDERSPDLVSPPVVSSTVRADVSYLSADRQRRQKRSVDTRRVAISSHKLNDALLRGTATNTSPADLKAYVAYRRQSKLDFVSPQPATKARTRVPV